ncbi:hypothetical protein [Natribacillus halophilus]|uniref:Uncharacterized protein n=1 Tax=Natribacillus halophilus TaxID=549003 RepID=A0A1G8M9U1_9BACI|nr:hypothetical protein [Natribacillus halophilus]SDI64749.1 hypothetical protein SAMN04488123_10454 [Natribacillus halophilus]
MSRQEILKKAAAKSAKRRGILSDKKYRQWVEGQTTQTSSEPKKAEATSRAKKALLKR